MPFAYRRRNARPTATAPTHTTGTTTRRGLFSRRRAAHGPTTVPAKRGVLGGKKTEVHHHHHHHHNHIGGASAGVPVKTQRRRPSMKDKVSGAFLKLKGSLTHRRGQKAAGTRRMHGTDGRVGMAHRSRW